MAPPSFSDLGKQARDVFNKNYNYSFVKLDCKTKTSGGMDFSVSGSSNIETGKVVSSLESKYKVPEYGLTMREKWSTDNVLLTEISVEDKPIKGCKLSVDGSLVPLTGKKSATVKSAAKLENLNLNVDLDVDMKTPVWHVAAVMGLRGWLVGGQASVNACKGNILRNTFAVGYATDDFVLHTNVNDGQEFGGSVYQKVNENLETGVQLAWSSGNNATSFGLGCVYSIDKDTSLRAKVNNSSQIGLGLSHRLRQGIQLTLSAMVDGRSFNQGGHKLGLGLDFEA
ncbi:voltage-dependent anion-selective channel protein 2 [Parasteatoda tepidariorum]|uniref:voltage-dependent anion-selective channel protein 2 n=1 Tax=Parasteatoda tepidariorum TaxID=114398 RepID=UPI000A2C0E15|nr:voltage-dependent anion-selective channel protein 2 [Parasteatoda tepidariorum]XP_042905040.1 voltage-dependent anion-selective channel protein 2 [Parasteatoda tepidariorum]XP_042905046.1 voltage-dependent anion-selective channel protein 2 [Parasteatoda tepidariorum]